MIRKLADRGQAILCTIHQPSAILLQEFDRLLFLQKGGGAVYFGDLGENCKTLINYFEKYGSSKCPPNANPAEWMLEVIGAAPGSHSSQNYYHVWLNSSEYKEMNEELDKMEKDAIGKPKEKDPKKLKQFAAPIWYQYLLVTERVFEQYWRTPSYTYSKVLMCIASSLLMVSYSLKLRIVYKDYRIKCFLCLCSWLCSKRWSSSIFLFLSHKGIFIKSGKGPREHSRGLHL